MDLSAIIVGILVVNVVTFLAGCALATYRARLERRANTMEYPARSSVPVGDTRLPAATRHSH
jgi:hypothetical protein